jgi:hypothetical protein
VSKPHYAFGGINAVTSNKTKIHTFVVKKQQGFVKFFVKKVQVVINRLLRLSSPLPLHSQIGWDMPRKKLMKVKDSQNSCKRMEYPTM